MALADRTTCRRRFGGVGTSFVLGVIVQLLARLLRNQRGASAAEYALILGIVGAAIALAALGLGDSIADSMNASSNQIANCGGGC